MSFFAFIFLTLGFSQLYWAWRGVRLARRKIESRTLRWLVCAAIPAILVSTFASVAHEFARRPEPVHLTLGDALLTAPAGRASIAGPARFFVANRQRGDRGSVRRRRLWVVLRAVESGDGRAARPPRQPARGVSRLSHRAALRHPHRA